VTTVTTVTTVTRRTGRSARVGLVALAVAALVVAANMAAHAHDAQLDLSGDRRFSLAPDSKALARAVRAPLRITAFLNAGGPAAQDARFLLARYRELNRRITFAVIDPDTNPGEARRFGVTQYSTVVLRYQGRRVDAPDAEELEISTAILRLVRGKSPTVCVLSGHGELAMDDTSPTGLSKVAQLLKDNAYQTQVLNLTVGALHVPTSCNAVLEIGPRDQLLPLEQTALADYAQTNGRLLVAVSPLTMADPNPLIRPWGVGFLGGLVLDPNRSIEQDPSDVVVQNLPSDSPVDSQVNELQFPAAGGLTVERNLASGLTVARLALSGPGSWNESHPDTELAFGPDDIPGPILVAAAADLSRIEPGSPAGLPSGAPRVARTRVLVTGSDTWLRNEFLDHLGNRRFLVNGLAWLTEQDQLVAATSKPSQVRALPFTAERQTETLALTVGVVPGAIVALGAVEALLIRRRRTRAGRRRGSLPGRR
jgi:ABC-type uncharacterized transport system involved in gliding motility auxiliary subunit